MRALEKNDFAGEGRLRALASLSIGTTALKTSMVRSMSASVWANDG